MEGEHKREGEDKVLRVAIRFGEKRSPGFPALDDFCAELSTALGLGEMEQTLARGLFTVLLRLLDTLKAKHEH